MGKGRRIRQGREARQEAEEQLKRFGGRRLPGERGDPNIAAIEATDGEKMSVRDGIEPLLASARENGCTCQQPGFSVEQLGDGVGHLRMYHDEACPLMRSLQDGPS